MFFIVFFLLLGSEAVQCAKEPIWIMEVLKEQKQCKSRMLFSVFWGSYHAETL